MARIQVLFEACPDAKGELKDYAAVAAGFLERVTPVEPPASLLSNLIDALHHESPPENEIPVVSTNGDTDP